tara:strand:- start:533 stop:658 length:126 start_codon:yes stop_codon:yes gene_type:complete
MNFPLWLICEQKDHPKEDEYTEKYLKRLLFKKNKIKNNGKP